MSRKRCPIPWKIKELDGAIYVLDAEDRDVLEFFESEKWCAILIVHAVNSHDAFIRAGNAVARNKSAMAYAGLKAAIALADKDTE